MDSLPLHPSNYHPRFPSRRRSTSQMCLHKILTIIATVPPLSADKSLAEGGAGCVNRVSESDLNSPEPEESRSSRGDLAEDVPVEIEEAERSLTLLIEAAQLIFGEFNGGDTSKRNCFALKNGGDDVAADVEPSGGDVARKNSCWTAAEISGGFEESSPVGRSKRGRARVLPCRYRDSVLEPLTRFSRSGSTALPVKRRRR